jgi:glucose/arabinose dehydrogenase
MIRRVMRRCAVVLSWLALGACDQTPVPAPPVVEPGPPQTVTGSERLGWNQVAADAAELGTFRYLVYVDGQRFELTGASCSRSSGNDDFGCSAPLPRMTPGAHALELATFVVEGTTFESSRSAAIQVTVAPSTLTSSQPAAESSGDSSIVTTDGVRLRLTPIVSGIVDPMDVAFTPDGRMLVAEREGRLRVVRDGRLLPAPAWTLSMRHSDQEQLCAVAVDPDFERSRFVYAIYTMIAARGELTFSLARFREANDTLGDRIVLRDDIAASPRGPSASLRFGPDGKLFAAFDAGGVPRLAADWSSPNGKILRLNTDGTTPGDQAGNLPLYASAYQSPRGLGWHLPTRMLWVASQEGESSLISAIGSDGPRHRGAVRAVFVLPAATVPSALAVYPTLGMAQLRGDLFIASDTGRHLLRVRLDPREPTRVAGIERLLQDRIGGVRSVVVGPDGAIYLGTAHAIWRLSGQT